MLRVEKIDVFYGRVQAIKSISFHVEAKGIVALLGANGAGKTTTLRTICGILSPSQGRITLEDERIDGLPTDKIIKKQVAMVAEGRRLFPEMTVLENLEVGAFNRKDREGIKSDLDRIYGYFSVLQERRLQRAASLSGGEQQMLAIGRALMSKPSFILIDELSLGLSPKMTQEIYGAVKKLHQEEVTLLVIEQNAALALRQSHRGYVLETGRITLQGTAQDLLGNEHVRKAYLGM